MSKFSIAIDYERPASKFTAYDRQPFNQRPCLRRMEQCDARRNAARTGALASPPRHLDAKLLEDGEALEAAWQYEIATLIAMKRLKTLKRTRPQKRRGRLARSSSAGSKGPTP